MLHFRLELTTLGVRLLHMGLRIRHERLEHLKVDVRGPLDVDEALAGLEFADRGELIRQRIAARVPDDGNRGIPSGEPDMEPVALVPVEDLYWRSRNPLRPELRTIAVSAFMAIQRVLRRGT